MNDCQIRGCRNLETRCKDCGRLVCEKTFNPHEWISIQDEMPPKDEPFLGITTGKRIEMLEWKERIINGENKGWFGFYCPCCCCNGHCSDNFSLWMPLPESPKE